jgi:hypothetical protein
MKSTRFHGMKIVSRLSAALADVDYAQRRLLEIRTGLPFGSNEHRLRRGASIEQLEVMYRRGDSTQ